MVRLARVVIPGMPHHVTQRGNRRQTTFFCQEDYAAYVELMGQPKKRSRCSANTNAQVESSETTIFRSDWEKPSGVSYGGKNPVPSGLQADKYVWRPRNYPSPYFAASPGLPNCFAIFSATCSASFL